MQLIDEVLKILRRTEPARRRKVPGYLVPPRAIERVLHYRHKLHVGIAHVRSITYQLVGNFAVSKVPVAFFRYPPPRTQVHLVNRVRLILTGSFIFPVLHPLLILPLVAAIPYHRGGAGWRFG